MRRKLQSIPFRRKRQGKTDYRKRIRLLKSKKIRLVIRPSINNISAQLVEYNPTGDKILMGVHSNMLEKAGWTANRGNTPSAYLVGYALGKQAMQKGIKEAIIDTGLKTPIKGGRTYACVKGVRDAGVTVPTNEEVLPTEERITGKHIKPEIEALFQKVKSTIEAKK